MSTTPRSAVTLDLVALATIADVVPLLDENRSLAIAGLRALARTQKPGLQALMRSAQVDPAAVDASAVGFRLAPRINAAGRLGRPDAALDLLLTGRRGRRSALPAELEVLNRDRQAVEDRILRAAVAEVESWPEPTAQPSRLRPLGRGVARGGDRDRRVAPRRALQPAGGDDRRRRGDWKGSGRSVPAFDLHGALAACSGHLERFGGHRAAAGLSIATRAAGGVRARPSPRTRTPASTTRSSRR